MDTLKYALSLVTPNCFLASCDLKDAYFSIPIRELDSLSCGPRVFTKLLKCAFPELRKRGFINTGYIDDSLLQGDTYEECEENILQTAKLFDELGFTVHPKKFLHHVRK